MRLVLIGMSVCLWFTSLAAATGLDQTQPLMMSAPYGMSKEEFGAFIEEHVRKALPPTTFQLPREGCSIKNADGTIILYLPRDDGCHIEDAPKDPG